MADYWEDMTEGFRQAGEGLRQAIDGLTRAAIAARTAAEEYGDLRETVHRLEALVLQQSADLKALRDRLNGT